MLRASPGPSLPLHTCIDICYDDSLRLVSSFLAAARARQMLRNPPSIRATISRQSFIDAGERQHFEQTPATAGSISTGRFSTPIAAQVRGGNAFYQNFGFLIKLRPKISMIRSLRAASSAFKGKDVIKNVQRPYRRKSCQQVPSPSRGRSGWGWGKCSAMPTP